MAKTDTGNTKKTRKKNTKEDQTLNLESILYNCRDYLRGSAALNDKRDVILTLVFLRFIGEKFEDAQAEMRQMCAARGLSEEMTEMFLNSPNRYKNIVYVPEAARWSKLINVSPAQLNAALDDALQAIEDSGEALKGCVRLSLFTTVNIQPNDLKKVIDEVNKISHKTFGEERDLIGRVYEYFLKSFAVNATKEDGEFYTPHDIVELIAAFIEPFDGTLYDPCCGSGGMFIQCAKYVEAKQGDITTVNVFGQEKEPATYRLAKMNLAMRGISHHLGDMAKSTFEKDLHAGLTFDYIMANPPFNLKHWFKAGITEGENWSDYGTPPESNANYAWILHMLSKLNAYKGIAGFLLANGALGDEDAKGIRQKLIEHDKVEAIVTLPHELFYTTDLSVTLWILNNNKKGGLHHGRNLRNRTGEILFMDLRTWTENSVKGEQKKKVELKADQVKRAVDIFFKWQEVGTDGINYAQPELYRSVCFKTLKDNDFSLVTSRYIEFVDRDSDIDYEKVLSESSRNIGTIVSKLEENNQLFKDAFALLGYPFSSSDVSLVEMDSYPKVRLGDYICEDDERNTDLKISLSQGISNLKFFQDPKQVAANSKSDKVVRTGHFAYNRATTRNGEKISIAYRDGEDCTVSSAYGVFHIIDTSLLNPYFLMMFFKRAEFDRYARWRSEGSAHEFFSFDMMKEVRIPLPPIHIQEAIVNVYKGLEEARLRCIELQKIAASICPALIQRVSH
jgi:type I restriction enzyme M protein